MNLSSGSRLLVSWEYREPPKFQIARDLAQTLKIEYFRDADSVILDKHYPIQVILLPEEDLPEWSKREFLADCTVGVILLESTEFILRIEPSAQKSVEPTLAAGLVLYQFDHGFEEGPIPRLSGSARIRKHQTSGQIRVVGDRQDIALINTL